MEEKESYQLQLSDGYSTLIDKEDLYNVLQYKWTWQIGYIYAGSLELRRLGITSLHRFLNKTPRGFHTHHVNGDKTDNRKMNLTTMSKEEHRHIQLPLRKKKPVGDKIVHVIIAFEDAEMIRKELKLHVNKFCMVLGVSRATYYAWKQRGISGTAQQLLRVMKTHREEVFKVLL